MFRSIKGCNNAPFERIERTQGLIDLRGVSASRMQHEYGLSAAEEIRLKTQLRRIFGEFPCAMRHIAIAAEKNFAK
jgi:hypothetical protein